MFKSLVKTSKYFTCDVETSFIFPVNGIFIPGEKIHKPLNINILLAFLHAFKIREVVR